MYVRVHVWLYRYYEVELLTDGMMRIGWATPTFPAGIPLGSDDKSYAYDGYLVSPKFMHPDDLLITISSLSLSFSFSPLPLLRPVSGTVPPRALVNAGRLVMLLAACLTLKKRP